MNDDNTYVVTVAQPGWYPGIRQASECQYLLLESFLVRSRGLQITMYAGFRFNGASIPRIAWGLLGSPFTGRYTLGACVHDGVYGIKMPDLVSRREGDLIFLDLMRRWGTNWLIRGIFYEYVRRLGWIPWGDYTDQEIAESRRYVLVEKF